MKKIFKIVLTGGPCAGKTTLISRINQIFSLKGYRIFTVNETATELINNGLKPFGDCVDMKTFQGFVLDTQLAKEKTYIKAAEFVKEDKVLIIFDRGLLDNKAYISDEYFSSLVHARGLTESKLRNSYDLVIHLVTAAKGAPEAYNLDNAARTEGIEEAIKLDERTCQCWVGHRHLRIIDNSNNFEAKMKKALDEISLFLGEPIPLENEKKFLIKTPDFSKIPTIKEERIIQTYLNKNGKDERRLRQVGTDNDYTHFYTERNILPGNEMIETEKRITQDDYLNLLVEADTSLRQIIKKRYYFLYNDQYFRLDIYPFSKDNALLEISLTDKNQELIIPDFIEVIEDVTFNDSYKNINIAKNLSFN